MWMYIHVHFVYSVNGKLIIVFFFLCHLTLMTFTRTCTFILISDAPIWLKTDILIFRFFLSQISADTDNRSDILHLSYTCLS